MPGQEQRSKSVRSKLNAIDLEFRGKNVLLVDDSIVRGTTSAQIIDMAREAGAKKVYFASAAPPVRYPNVYGIDMPDASELVAAGHTDERGARHHRRRLAHLPGSARSGARGAPRQRQDQGFRHVLLFGRIRHRRRDAGISQAAAERALRRGEAAAARRRAPGPQDRSASCRSEALVRRHRHESAAVGDGGSAPTTGCWSGSTSRSSGRTPTVVEHRLGEDAPLEPNSPPPDSMRWCWWPLRRPPAVEQLAADLAAKPEFAPVVLVLLQRCAARAAARHARRCMRVYGRKIDRRLLLRGLNERIARAPPAARHAAFASRLRAALPLRFGDDPRPSLHQAGRQRRHVQDLSGGERARRQPGGAQGVQPGARRLRTHRRASTASCRNTRSSRA